MGSNPNPGKIKMGMGEGLGASSLIQGRASMIGLVSKKKKR